jgi:predicted transposase YdaD
MALNTLIHVSQDERERAINRSRRMWQTDMESNMYTARESGRIEGITVGRAEGITVGRAEGITEGRDAERREMILKMRRANMTDEQIASICGLPVDTVRKIAAG